MISPHLSRKLIYKKEALLDVDVTLSCQEATLPTKPSESLLCETDLKTSTITITYAITMAHEDFRISST